VPQTSQGIRVLLVDAVQLRSQLLLDALRRHREFTANSCAVEGGAVMRSLDTSPSDVVIVGSARRGATDALAVVRRIHLANPELATVLLTDSVDAELVVNTFRCGARGIFCFAGSDFAELCKCIRRVYEGQIWATSPQLRYALDVLTHVPSLRVVNADGDDLLSEREVQVVSLVADGLTNRVIAQELGLSENTIKKYLFRIFEKLGISTRVELVLYAFHHGGTREAEWVQGD
jgi:DNA-binding NarL/FixJ family response regulator